MYRIRGPRLADAALIIPCLEASPISTSFFFLLSNAKCCPARARIVPLDRRLALQLEIGRVCSERELISATTMETIAVDAVLSINSTRGAAGNTTYYQTKVRGWSDIKPQWSSRGGENFSWLACWGRIWRRHSHDRRKACSQKECVFINSASEEFRSSVTCSASREVRRLSVRFRSYQGHSRQPICDRPVGKKQETGDTGASTTP